MFWNSSLNILIALHPSLSAQRCTSSTLHALRMSEEYSQINAKANLASLEGSAPTTWALAFVALILRFTSRRISKAGLGLDDWLTIPALVPPMMTALRYVLLMITLDWRPRPLAYFCHWYALLILYLYLTADDVKPSVHRWRGQIRFMDRTRRAIQDTEMDFYHFFVLDHRIKLHQVFGSSTLYATIWAAFEASLDNHLSSRNSDLLVDRQCQFIQSKKYHQTLILIIQLFVVIFGCIHPSDAWTGHMNPGICPMDSHGKGTAAIMHVIIDLLILLAPIPMLSKSKLHRKQKLVLCGIFGLGALYALSLHYQLFCDWQA